jgi:hypothetical protein
MKQFFLHIVSMATLSALIIVMGVGVAVLPKCCQMAGEELSVRVDAHTCHCHQDQAVDQMHDQESSMHDHCKVTIEKKDLILHTQHDIVEAPVDITLPHASLLPTPQFIMMKNNIYCGGDQPHSPPDIVGRMKFFSTFLI